MLPAKRCGLSQFATTASSVELKGYKLRKVAHRFVLSKLAREDQNALFVFQSWQTKLRYMMTEHPEHLGKTVFHRKSEEDVVISRLNQSYDNEKFLGRFSSM